MRRILVIEDDRILRRFVRRLLELEGYTALEAADGDEGLARAHEEDCDLVLLDIRMPKRDGWSVLEELKKAPKLKDIPVVMWTAVSEPGDESKAREMGASDFLIKPVLPDALLSSIGVALAGDKNRVSRASRHVR